MQVLCKDKVMCTSTVFLKFLGFSHDADVTYFKRRAHYLRIDCSGHAEVRIHFGVELSFHYSVDIGL